MKDDSLTPAHFLHLVGGNPFQNTASALNDAVESEYTPTEGQITAAHHEGMKAATGGAAATHNPYIYSRGSVELQRAWAEGQALVATFADRQVQIHNAKARELGMTLDLFSDAAQEIAALRAQIDPMKRALDAWQLLHDDQLRHLIPGAPSLRRAVNATSYAYSQLKAEAHPIPPLVKGAFNGLCNRQACQVPGATWFNSSTRAYYCPACAAKINEFSAQADGYLLCSEQQGEGTA